MLVELFTVLVLAMNDMPPPVSVAVLAPITKPVPLIASVPPPVQMCVGVAPVTVGGGTKVMLNIAAVWQSAGGGFVIVTM
jgi:hypothetical protein